MFCDTLPSATRKSPPTKRSQSLAASTRTTLLPLELRDEAITPLPPPLPARALQLLLIVSNFATLLAVIAGVAPVPPRFAVVKEPATKRLLSLTASARTVLLTPLPLPCESALQVLVEVSNFANRLTVMAGVSPVPP